MGHPRVESSETRHPKPNTSTPPKAASRILERGVGGGGGVADIYPLGLGLRVQGSGFRV